MRMIRWSVMRVAQIPVCRHSAGQWTHYRPLLCSSRRYEAYCRRLRLTPIQDPSNSCDDYLRNRIRHHLMPLLHEYNPRLQQALSRLADAARHDNTWLDALTDRFIAEQTFATDGGWWCPMQTFLQQPLAMQRRVVRTLAQRASAAEDAWSVQDLEFGHTQAIIALLRKSVTGPLSAAFRASFGWNGRFLDRTAASSTDIPAQPGGAARLPYLQAFE